MITRMLILSANDVAHFLLFCMMLLFAYSFAVQLPFAIVSEQFNGVFTAAYTLFDLISGIERYDYGFLCATHPFLMPLLTTSYLVVMVLILINVFIAILMDAYNIVVADPRTECTLAEEMEEGFVRRWSGRGQPDVEELYPALLEHGYRGNYSYNQLVQLVKSPLQAHNQLH